MWLIVIAFFISRGFIKTGLGERIAYLFMVAVGHTSLGLAYSLVAADVVLAPAMPSNTAHVVAMYSAFLVTAIAAGTPPMLAALVFAFFSSLFASMTHYSTGPAAVFFSSGYVEMGAWWRLGALVSVVNILIWLGVGGLWWKVIGVW